jgi:hypothetical protein
MMPTEGCNLTTTPGGRKEHDVLKTISLGGFAAILLLGTAHAAALGDLRSHRAVYDVEMIESSERSGIGAMNGRIVYEISGSVCDGFAVRFRFLTNVQAGRRSLINDQRATVYESAEGDSFEFVSQGYLNGQKETEVKGSAERTAKGLEVTLEDPEEKIVELDDAMFQTQHTAALIDAARDGETVLEARVFDGSDNGDVLNKTTSFIGKERLERDAQPGEPDDIAEMLSSKPSWPVSVSYFSDDDEDQAGERLPTFRTSFLMLEDGVSRDLIMRFDDYELRGALIDLEYLPETLCEASN